MPAVRTAIATRLSAGNGKRILITIEAFLRHMSSTGQDKSAGYGDRSLSTIGKKKIRLIYPDYISGNRKQMSGQGNISLNRYSLPVPTPLPRQVQILSVSKLQADDSPPICTRNGGCYVSGSFQTARYVPQTSTRHSRPAADC